MKKYLESYPIKKVRKGDTIKYKGSKFIVVDNDGYSLTIRSGDKTIRINQSQFNRDVQINEAMKTKKINIKEFKQIVKQLIKEEINSVESQLRSTTNLEELKEIVRKKPN